MENKIYYELDGKIFSGYLLEIDESGGSVKFLVGEHPSGNRPNGTRWVSEIWEEDRHCGQTLSCFV